MTKNIKKYSILVFLFTVITHGINLFNFPAFLGDEGIYTFQAWWTVNFQKLSPYTYWYDHSPFGWLLIGLWQKLTGGPFTFAFSLFSTRIFMVLIAGLTNVFIFKLVKLLTKSNKWALIASFIYTFTPLGLIYHRQVLLDNLETCFLVLSLFSLFTAKKRSLIFLLSGIFFGLAFLSKEIVIILLPVFILGLWWESKGENQTYSRFLWLSSGLFLIFLFPLMALLKGEFWPSSWTGGQHVSFLETVLFQLSRGSNLKPWRAGSFFSYGFKQWLTTDYFLVLAGLWAMLINLVYLQKDKRGLFFSLLALSYWLFLARGGFILGFYFIPLIALYSINIGLALPILKNQFNFLFKNKTILLLAGSFILIWLIKNNWPIFTVNLTKNQIEAVQYIKQKLPPEAMVVVYDYAFLDIRLSRYKDDPGFDNADWYSKVENDPEVRMAKLANNWNNIDYIMIDGYMELEMQKGNLPFLQNAIEHAELIQNFSNGEENKGGIKIGLYKLNKKEANQGFNVVVIPPTENLTIEEKVGSLFMVGIEGKVLSNEDKTRLQQNHFKNFLLLQRNIGTLDQLKSLTSSLCVNKESPCWIGVDQEGGVVNPIYFGNIDLTQSGIKTEEQAYEIGLTRAKELKDLGINVNLAPVLEISHTDWPFISQQNRAFTGDESFVVRLADQLILGQEEGGILSVVKHYPFGLGRTALDPHWQLPVVDIDRETLDNDLLVLKQLIEKNRVKAVMVTHLKYPKIDPVWPASLSPEFYRILRQDLGFTGLIITDDLAMRAITNQFPITEAAQQAIKAGADMVMISGTPGDQQGAYQGVLEAVNRGEIEIRRIDEANVKIKIKMLQ